MNKYAKVHIVDGNMEMENSVPLFTKNDLTNTTDLAVVNLSVLEDLIAGLPEGKFYDLKDALQVIIKEADNFGELDEKLERAMGFHRTIRNIADYIASDKMHGEVEATDDVPTLGE